MFGSNKYRKGYIDALMDLNAVERQMLQELEVKPDLKTLQNLEFLSKVLDNLMKQKGLML
jgi:hypothetical protein